MRVFLAGATGVLGIRIVPLLVADGHTVAGMTRSPSKSRTLTDLGAEPVVCDVYDAAALARAVQAFAPEVVLHELTDLPDDASALAEHRGDNARMRREGTRNLLAAAGAAGVRRLLAQSIAWETTGDGAAAKQELERAVLDFGGVVLRYGQLYGPGTYYEGEPPPHPRVHVDHAARRTVDVLGLDHTVVTIAEPNDNRTYRPD
jgi:nucleoside-diphosphate-sugar epimerase